MKLSDYVVQFIASKGVRHVFFIPGGGAMHLNNSLGNCGDIEFVCNLHEQASAIAAEAYSRVSGGFGAAMVTTGPGGTNSVTGVLAAWQDSTPCFFISGQVKRADITTSDGPRQIGVQEVDMVSIVNSITKYAVTVLEPETIRFHLEKAAWLARSGRPGPVWIDIPLDVQAAEIEPEKLSSFFPPEEKIGISESDIEKVIDSFNKAERPVVLLGDGIRLAGAAGLVSDLLALLKAPTLTTRLGVDLISWDHPLCMGMPGTIASRGANFTLQNADWLLSIGARLDFALIAYAPEKLARAAVKIMVNIDGTEISKLKVIDIPIAGDAKLFIEKLLEARSRIQSRDIGDWLIRCRGWKEKYPFVTKEHYSAREGLSLYAFSDSLSAMLEPGDIVLPGNSGFAAEIFLTAFKAKAGQRVFHNKGTGSMGFCQPAAIGACLAAGGRRTVCVDGDGGFQFNIQELETVKRLDLPVKFFVINNGGFASIRASQKSYFKKLTAADNSSGLTLPDLSKISNAYGIDYVGVSSTAELEEKLPNALAGSGPVICEVVVIPDEPRMPRVTAMQRADGSMVSKPLEDMWPFLPRDEFRSNMMISPMDDDG